MDYARPIYILGIIVSILAGTLLVPVIINETKLIFRTQYLVKVLVFTVISFLFIYNIYSIYFYIERLQNPRVIDLIGALYTVGDFILRLIASSMFYIAHRAAIIQKMQDSVK